MSGIADLGIVLFFLLGIASNIRGPVHNAKLSSDTTVDDRSDEPRESALTVSSMADMTVRCPENAGRRQHDGAATAICCSDDRRDSDDNNACRRTRSSIEASMLLVLAALRFDTLLPALLTMLLLPPASVATAGDCGGADGTAVATTGFRGVDGTGIACTTGGLSGRNGFSDSGITCERRGSCCSRREGTAITGSSDGWSVLVLMMEYCATTGEDRSRLQRRRSLLSSTDEKMPRASPATRLQVPSTTRYEDDIFYSYSQGKKRTMRRGVIDWPREETRLRQRLRRIAIDRHTTMWGRPAPPLPAASPRPRHDLKAECDRTRAERHMLRATHVDSTAYSAAIL